jgi:hypothetical protein
VISGIALNPDYTIPDLRLQLGVSKREDRQPRDPFTYSGGLVPSGGEPAADPESTAYDWRDRPLWTYQNDGKNGTYSYNKYPLAGTSGTTYDLNHQTSNVYDYLDQHGRVKNAVWTQQGSGTHAERGNDGLPLSSSSKHQHCHPGHGDDRAQEGAQTDTLVIYQNAQG